MKDDPARKHVEVVRDFSAIHEIRNQPGKDLWLFGGADLTTQFFNSNLIDEFFLSIHPVVLGAGKPLFQNISERKWLKIIDTQTFDSGLINVRYAKIRSLTSNIKHLKS